MPPRMTSFPLPAWTSSIPAFADDEVVAVPAVQTVGVVGVGAGDEAARRQPAAGSGADVAHQRDRRRGDARRLVVALVDGGVVAHQDVLARATDGEVGCRATGHVVVADTAIDAVAVRAADDDVVAGVAGAIVAAGTTAHVV